ncbi:PREDICTED: zinc finger protein 260-like [Habropoda laboriosa]|uniref:zinc finger protein 260-like n=1 Tax=Habropoda laboriosa TaxID=597456 RepID=UPI00083DD48F|nr:PREDICTED: zinc finger protein 260-like [Habropoda laboriosa]
MVRVTPYQCPKCLKYFKSSQSCWNHRNTCGTDKKFRCAICGYRSHQKGNVYRHLTRHHPATSQRERANCVQRVIDRERNTLSFDNEPSENKPIEENSDLPVQAWKIHEQGLLPFAELKIPKAYNFVGKKPPGQFGCSRCGRSYMRKDSLQRHVQWECGKEPQFQCPFCPQRSEDLSITGLKWAAAWQRWSVPSIMWRSGGGLGKGLGSGSSNPEGFNCPACGRVYKLKSSLRNHQKWECGKEPQFQCPHCVYRAKQKMHIARHMERMHKEKIYKQELV